MKYIKEIPTKPGWYWVRDSSIKDGEIKNLIGCFMYSDTDEMYFIVPGMFEAEKADNRFEYAGPIEEPEE